MTRILLLSVCLLYPAALRGQEVKSDDVLIVASSGPSNGILVNSDWRVSRDRLEKQPQWDPLNEKGAKSPPLSAAAAARIAVARIQKRFPDVKQWQVSQIGLYSLNTDADGQRREAPKPVFPNRWYYFVFVGPTDKTQAAAVKSKMQYLWAVILMDGSVVTPVFSEAATIQQESK